ncbi:hypothetical protein D9758_006935 [Tetrapyrgos nigripes]|uniref:F-box domain-containing protein n=1 Tax=Tetrapyrgos nigripes TaxID=182062 RepID=A0A8H5LUP9_9AGAR|nr:hypothetical protein D9758_006935 [Tetrapyrgos nigripes]
MPQVAIQRPEMLLPTQEFEGIDHFLAFLRSAYCGYFPDIADISRSLSVAENEMQRCLEGLFHLDPTVELEQMQTLRWEMDELERRVAGYRSLLAPIRRLPAEIFCYIFELFCLEEGSKFGIQPDCPAGTISQVCAGWRELARAMPELWSSVSIHLLSTLERTGRAEPFPDSGYVAKVPQGFDEEVMLPLRMHLGLSRQAPLDIDVVINPEPVHNLLPRPDGLPMAQLYFDLSHELSLCGELILKSLIPHSGRWRNFHFSPTFEDLLGCVKGKVPLLRSLKLGWYTNEWTLRERIDADNFENTPDLRVVSLFGRRRVNLSWGQLTEYALQYSEDFSELFRAQGVTTAILYACGYTDDEFGLVFIDELRPKYHDLHSLSIVLSSEFPDIYQYFQRMTLPHLDRLSILGKEGDPPLTTNEFWHPSFASIYTDFLSRSSCTITSLSLVNIAMWDSDAMHLIFHLQFLASLTIHDLEEPKTFADPALFSKLQYDRAIITGRFLASLMVYDDDPYADATSTTFKLLRQYVLGPPDCSIPPPRTLYLPRLQSLDLRFHPTFPSDLVFDVVHSRLSGPRAELGEWQGTQRAVDGLGELKLVVFLKENLSNGDTGGESESSFNIQELSEWLGDLGLQFTCSSKLVSPVMAERKRRPRAVSF